MKNAKLTFLFYVFAFSLQAQTIKIKTNTYEWPIGKPQPIAVEDQFKNEDAVILDEKEEITILTHKEPIYVNGRLVYYKDEYDFTLNIKKNYRIKFLTSEGVKKYSTIWLPENFDDAGNYADTLFADRNLLHRPKGSVASMKSFSARIIHADGKKSEATIEQVFEKESFFMQKRGNGFYNSELEHFINPSGLSQTETYVNAINTDLFSFGFQIKNLKPGDEVEINCSYLTFDQSKRIYLSSNLPKQNLELNISYDDKDVYAFRFLNGANPDNVSDSLILGIVRNFKWTRKNLVSITSEFGSRMNESLPYITYYKHNQDFGILKNNGDYEKLLPYTWEAVYLSFVNYVEKGFKKSYSNDSELAKRFFKRPDKNTVALNNFFETNTTGIPDSSLFKRFNAVHTNIVNNFNFDDDKNAFNDNLEKLENIGKYTENNTLRNMSRQRLYNEMAARLRDDYYLTLLCDKRVERIDIKTFSPINFWKYYFVIVDKKNPFYFYPKHHRFGLYANEMPFYLEDATTFLIPQTEPDSNTWHQVTHATFYAIKTPYSSLLDNMRTCNTLVNVNTQNFSSTFDAKVELKGQFSTMQRGFYKYAYTDASVNPKYNKRICDLPYAVKVDSVLFDNQLEEFPFTANIRVKYSSGNFIKPLADGGYEINLAGLCTHIIYDNLDTTNRHLDFYTDFVSQDAFKYFIKFDKPVTVVNAADFNKEEKNSFGALKINIVNAQPDVIMIESKFVVSSEKVEAKNIGDVGRLFSAIEKMNNGKLQLR